MFGLHLARVWPGRCTSALWRRCCVNALLAEPNFTNDQRKLGPTPYLVSCHAPFAALGAPASTFANPYGRSRCVSPSRRQAKFKT